MGNEEIDTDIGDGHHQLQQGDSLEDRGVDDILDEGIVTRERWSSAQGFGNTAAEQREGASLERQLSWEESEDASDEWEEEWKGDDLADEQAGHERSGRLVAASDDDDRFVSDVGIDGAGASAEEAAMHVIDSDDL